MKKKKSLRNNLLKSTILILLLFNKNALWKRHNFRNALRNILLKITLLKHTLLKKKTRPQLENWLAEQFFGLMV